MSAGWPAPLTAIAPLTDYRPVCQQSWYKAYSYADLAVSSIAVAGGTTSTHFAYPRRDGLGWVPGSVPGWFIRPKTVTHAGSNRAWRRLTTLIESNALRVRLRHTGTYGSSGKCLITVSNNSCDSIQLIYNMADSWRNTVLGGLCLYELRGCSGVGGFNCPLARAMDGHIMRCGTIGSCQSAATSEIVKRCWSWVWHKVAL